LTSLPFSAIISTVKGVFGRKKGGSEMVRRNEPPFDGRRYVGDKRQQIVHDLDREACSIRGCRITNIQSADVVTFEPDTLREAYRRGFDFCPSCIGET
jgi:hypothetical protein